MLIKKEIINNVEYTVIKYNSEPKQEELIRALDIIHNSEHCKVILWNDIYPNSDFIYYKNGKVHNELGIAIHLGAGRFYGIDGEIEQTYENFDKKYYNKLLRWKKLKILKNK